MWRRLAAAAPMGPLAWELPYVVGAVLKKRKERKRKEKKKKGVQVKRSTHFTHKPKIRFKHRSGRRRRRWGRTRTRDR